MLTFANTIKASFLKNSFTTLEAGRNIIFQYQLYDFGTHKRRVTYFNDKAFRTYLPVLKNKLGLSLSPERREVWMYE